VFHSAATEYSEAEAQELKALLAEPTAKEYNVDREYRRTLTVRAMKVLVAGKNIEVRCERSWRANF